MSPVGVGIIGCGDIARVRFFPGVAALPELKLTGIYSRTPAACAPLAKQYGGKVYADLDAFLAAPDIDAVIITTPHPSHAEFAVRALAAGKHVLTEKPMATSVADARRILEAADRSDGVFMALPFDGFPPMIEARRLIGSGVIGRVTSADAMLGHQGPTHAPWFFDRDEAEWGVLADLGIYLISQLTTLFGPAVSVTGRVATIFPERTSRDGTPVAVTVEDSAAAVITWPGEIFGSIRANWCSAADHRNVLWDLRVYGTKGAMFINMAAPANRLVVYSPESPVGGAEKIDYNGMSECYRPVLPDWDGHGDIVRAFAEAIAAGKHAGSDWPDAARQEHVIEIIAGIYESSESGAVKVLSG